MVFRDTLWMKHHICIHGSEALDVGFSFTVAVAAGVVAVAGVDGKKLGGGY